MSETKVLVFSAKDRNKDGTLKKKNSSVEMTEEQFKEHIKSNNLSVSYGYIDILGSISDGRYFKCSYRGMVIGVSSLVKTIRLGEVKA